MNERGSSLFSIQMALRQIPKGILRDMAKRRLPSDDLCEKIAAENCPAPRAERLHDQQESAHSGI